MPFNNQPSWSNRPTAYDAISGLVDSIQGRQDRNAQAEQARQRQLMALYAQDPTTARAIQTANPNQYPGFNAPDIPQPPPPPPDPEIARQAQERQDQADQAIADQYNSLSLAQQKVAFAHLPPGSKRLVPDPSTIPDAPAEGPKPMTEYEKRQIALRERGLKDSGRRTDAYVAGTNALTAERNKKMSVPEAHANDLDRQASTLERQANSGIVQATGQPMAPDAKQALVETAVHLRQRAATIRKNFSLAPQQQVVPPGATHVYNPATGRVDPVAAPAAPPEDSGQ